MKKIIAALAAIMMFVPAFSLAEEAAPAAADEPAAMAEAEAVEDEVGDELNAEAEEGGWYELSEDGTVLTVPLPMMASEDGYEWLFEAEDGSPLELLTSETTTDEDGDPMWVGSFRSTATADAAAVLTFKYAKGDNFPAFQCLLLTSLTADSKIAVESANVEDYTWLEVDDEDGKTLYIGLEANETTGYSWSWITDRDGALNMVLDTYISDDDGDDEVVGMGGMWFSAFSAAEGITGDVTLTLNYAQAGSETPDVSNIVNLAVADDGTITIKSVDSIMPLTAAE